MDPRCVSLSIRLGIVSKQTKTRSRIPLNGRLTFVVQHVHAFQKGWDVVHEKKRDIQGGSKYL